MKLSKTKITLFSVAGIIILSLILVLLCFNATTDTKNVTVEGYIIDKISNKPVENARIGIQNYRYEGDNGESNFDEFLGTDITIVCSDKQGLYHTSFDKSAYVVVTVMKDGYETTAEKGRYSSKNMKFKTILKRK